jgi:hypothetical protein
VLLANRHGVQATHRLAELLPGAFDARFLRDRT